MQVAVRCSCGSWAAIDVVVEAVASSCSPDLAVPDGQCDAKRRAFPPVSNAPLMTSSSRQNHSRRFLRIEKSSINSFSVCIIKSATMYFFLNRLKMFSYHRNGPCGFGWTRSFHNRSLLTHKNTQQHTHNYFFFGLALKRRHSRQTP